MEINGALSSGKSQQPNADTDNAEDSRDIEVYRLIRCGTCVLIDCWRPEVRWAEWSGMVKTPMEESNLAPYGGRRSTQAELLPTSQAMEIHMAPFLHDCSLAVSTFAIALTNHAVSQDRRDADRMNVVEEDQEGMRGSATRGDPRARDPAFSLDSLGRGRW